MPLYNPPILTRRLFSAPVSTGGLSNLGTSCIPASGLVSLAESNTNFPITAEAFATAAGVAGMTPSHIFACQETSGPLICSITGQLLSAYPFFATSPEMGVATAGLEGGTRTAIRLDDNTTQAFQASNTTLMDPLYGSVAWFTFFRCATDISNRTLMSKGSGLTGADPETKCGFNTYFSSTGLLGTQGSDGTTGSGTALVGTKQTDDTWRIAGSVYDSTNDTITAMHNISSNSQSTAGLTLINNHSYFTVGQGIDGGRYPSPPVDVTYIILFEGAAAEAVTSAGLATFLAQAVT